MCANDRLKLQSQVLAVKQSLLALQRVGDDRESCHVLVRVGGVILIDNTLWGGSVADDTEHDPSTEAIRAFNNFVHEDQRVEMVLLPIGDGLTLARKIV